MTVKKVDNLIPLPVPRFVKEGPAITFLSVILFFAPSFALVYLLSEKVCVFINTITGKYFEIPIILLVFIGFSISFFPPFIFGFSRTSKFILECVQWHINNNDNNSAKKLALALDYQVWFREWKRNSWFRQFVIESNLHVNSKRYARFSDKLSI